MKTNLSRVLAISSLAFFTVVACKEEAKDSAMAEVKIPGIILENMDTSVNPKDDFYNYVNGSWVKNNTIPDDESRWG
ncbi:MAG: M13 family peptidase, partial [Winogradskyella sp.]